MFKEAESRPDKIESTSNNVQVRKKQQHRRRACDLLASLCSIGFCNAPKALNESVKITELDGFTSLIQSKASNNAINSAVYTEHKSGIFS